MNSRSILGSAALVASTAILSVGLQAFATTPSTTPPGGNAYAPLNTGPNGQIKTGGLTLATGSGVTVGLKVASGRIEVGDTSAYPNIAQGVGLMLVNKQIRIVDGTQAAGRVLTSDADGVATWQSASDVTRVQGGIAYGTEYNHNVTLSTPFANTNYAVVLGMPNPTESNSSQCMQPYVTNKTASSFIIKTNDKCAQVNYNWVAIKY